MHFRLRKLLGPQSRITREFLCCDDFHVVIHDRVVLSAAVRYDARFLFVVHSSSATWFEEPNDLGRRTGLARHRADGAHLEGLGQARQTKNKATG